jgi:CubicO group peptidase (beta-lactamase class C family)
MTPRVARVTLRQLLTMTGGFADTWDTGPNAMYASANWMRFVLAHQDRTPGVRFQYSDYGAHLLSPILVNATGQSALTYARAKLFEPLRISTTPAAQPRADRDRHLREYMRAQFAWPVDPQGFNLGFAWIKLRPRDMAKFGQLYLQAGRWRDKQVVPAAWVRQATIEQAGRAFAFESHGPFDPQNYGYLWWVEKTDGVDAYVAVGFGGQHIEVVPARHLVIVISSDVNFTDPNAATVAADDTQRLADIIVRRAG